MFRASLRESGNSKILRTWQTTAGQVTKRKQGLGCEQYASLMPCSPTTKDVKGWLGVYRDTTKYNEKAGGEKAVIACTL